MNIYLDTNILFADPMFRSNYNQLLIKSAEEGAVSIYIPDICLLELLFKLHDKAIVLDNELKNKIRDFNRWTDSDILDNTFDIKEYDKKIELFYSNKFSSKTFCLLTNKPEFFSENLEKAIKGTAPFFTDKKEEFRDSLIWSIVREHSLINRDIKAYLLTANFQDYWNNDKTDLHSNLKKENKELNVADSIKKLFEIEPNLLDYKKKEEFNIWLGQQSISIEHIKNAVDKYLWNHISGSIDSNIKSFSIKGLNTYHEIGYVEPRISKDNFVTKSIDKVILLEDFATFEISAELKFEGKLFVPDFEKRDFSKFETHSFIANITLIVSYDRDEVFKPISLNISRLEIE